MKKHSPTPWRAVNVGSKAYVANDERNVIDAGAVTAADAVHIVHCVNLHDELVAMIGNLRGALWAQVGDSKLVLEADQLLALLHGINAKRDA